MGHPSFLTAAPSGGQPSLEEALYELENCSVLFVRAWQQAPIDTDRAGRVSVDAMRHLDHITNEILRARDYLKAQGLYAASPLKVQLNHQRGSMVAPVTHADHAGTLGAGAGNASLPRASQPITLERLLNKIKHRHHTSTNFRINPGERHILVINVDTPTQTPDSIVEFDVADFCSHCRSVASHV